MRMTLVISSLWGGGAERVVSLLASGWAEQGNEVTVLTFDHGEGHSYPLHPRVKRRCLGLRATSSHFLQGLYRNLGRIRTLRRAVRESRPDMVISAVDATNVLVLLATRWLRVPVIIMEQTDPALHDIGRTWHLLRRLVYPLANALVCPVSASLARFQAMTRVQGCTIPNPFAVPPGPVRRDREQERPTLLAMGRLVHQKGFDLLLNAFAQIADHHPLWSLTILGEGPLKSELQGQIEALELEGRVKLLGAVEDPFPYLYAADMFVFSSRFEGFPLALCEAMACGLPVVSFDCPEGPAAIIRHQADGILIPAQNVKALAAEMAHLMSDPAARQRLAARAPEVLERFSAGRILAMWQQLFENLLSPPSRVPY
jgi:GalNAc-alpha-(1->4)-GalNAc-alpha-(1->3)-diNAcBac-PP-undecaprenol alpha-1,4-N-acetyl-D-galactosaminyltransferase